MKDEIPIGEYYYDGETYRPIINTHIDDIQHGDIILHNGKVTTVNREYISKGGFMGTSILGDTYLSGLKPVKKLIYNWVDYKQFFKK